MSTYTLDLEDPPFTSVRYEILARDASGKWVYPAASSPFLSSPERNLIYWNSGFAGLFTGVSALWGTLRGAVTYSTGPNSSQRFFDIDVKRAAMSDYAPIQTSRPDEPF